MHIIYTHMPVHIYYSHIWEWSPHHFHGEILITIPNNYLGIPILPWSLNMAIGNLYF